MSKTTTINIIINFLFCFLILFSNQIKSTFYNKNRQLKNGGFLSVVNSSKEYLKMVLIFFPYRSMLIILPRECSINLLFQLFLSFQKTGDHHGILNKMGNFARTFPAIRIISTCFYIISHNGTYNKAYAIRNLYFFLSRLICRGSNLLANPQTRTICF